MAVIFTLLGGILGFVSALMALLVFDVSLLLALGLWSGIGIAALLIGLTLAPLLRSKTENKLSPHTA
jgi:uncharacterized membrane protein YjfL (UPF0719 family)